MDSLYIIVWLHIFLCHKCDDQVVYVEKVELEVYTPKGAVGQRTLKARGRGHTLAYKDTYQMINFFQIQVHFHRVLQTL